MIWSGLLILGAIIGLGAYFLLGSQWMRSTARAAGVADPTSPYQETITGSGACQLLKVTVLGDSTAIGTGTSSRQQTFSYQVIRQALLPIYAKVEYVNRAVSGAKINDVLTAQLPAALEDRPDLVFISIGANDVTGLTSADDFKTSLRQVLNSLTALPDTRVVLLGVPAVYSAPLLLPLFPTALDSFTKRLIETETALLASYDPRRVVPVDIYNTTGPIFKANPGLFAPDKYHPNDQGYTVWSNEINKVLEPRLKANQSNPDPCSF